MSARQGVDPEGTGIRKSLNLLLTSPGGAALITVVIGGLVIGVLSAHLQNRFKERELQLVAAQEHSRERLAAVQKLYALVGRASAHSREALALAEEPFRNTAGLTPTEHERVALQKGRVVSEFNLFLRDWNSERDTLGVLLLYYYPCAPEVLATWGNLEDACNRYLSCSIRARNEVDIDQCAVAYYEVNSHAEQLSTLLAREWRTSARDAERMWGRSCD